LAVRDYPDGLAESSVALQGVTEQAINAEPQSALRKLKAGLRKLGLSDEDPPGRFAAMLPSDYSTGSSCGGIRTIWPSR
jgi:hypothetical protein